MSLIICIFPPESNERREVFGSVINGALRILRNGRNIGRRHSHIFRKRVSSITNEKGVTFDPNAFIMSVAVPILFSPAVSTVAQVHATVETSVHLPHGERALSAHATPLHPYAICKVAVTSALGETARYRR
jgi:hypothetical protein